MADQQNIFFFNEAPITYRLKQKTNCRNWLNAVAQTEQHIIKQLNYIFCSDEYLLNVNMEHLNHHTYTDIITFDNSDKTNEIEGDIFISIHRVKENALTYKVPLVFELHRVMVHGLLHLCGYKDKSKTQQKTMRDKEDFYLEIS